VGRRGGAGDDGVKPLCLAWVGAPLHAVRRWIYTSPTRSQPVVCGDLAIDPASRRVQARGEEVQLTQREFDVLLFLARHPGQVFSRNQLMDAIWQYSFYTDTSTVTVHIRRLRAKIESDPSQPRHIQTVWGVGCRFQP
jgi:DNA-binding response OmpR family regulator